MKKIGSLLIMVSLLMMASSCKKHRIKLQWTGNYEVLDTLNTPSMSGGTASTARAYSIGISMAPRTRDEILITNMLKVGDTRTFTAEVTGDHFTASHQKPDPAYQNEHSYSFKGSMRNDSVFFSGEVYHPLGDPSTKFRGVAIKQ